MEVSHREDLVTHAVISTNEVQAFGMSDSAEFFNILSSTLYKNQHLAVVRETLCNAWDAHIDAGVTHLPVEVTMTAERLVIRDFGKGIPDDKNKMRERYCVYGSSTKTHDGKQTGGFGLGCKAPFAYADHFEVISNHNGVKSIYNMSKSNAQTDGKPGMIKLASMPTEDTGLQVSIDIKNVSDYGKFNDLIRTVTSQGDLRVKLNSTVLPILGFDLSKSNFIIVPYDTFPGSDKLYVRYGNVIYPIEYCTALEVTKKEVIKVLDSLVYQSYYSPYIIFQAPPHSISVQPSREGLSMKEHTINTLEGLMQAFLKQYKQEFLPTCMKIRHADILQQVKEGNLVKLLNAHKQSMDGTRSRNEPSIPNNLRKIQTMQQVAERAMYIKPPEIPGYKEKDLAVRIQAMSQAGMLDRGLASTFLRDLAVQVKDNAHGSDWLMRRILAPLAMATKAAGLLEHRLFVKHSYAYQDKISETLTTASYYKETRLVTVAPFLRNILVVTHKLTNLEERLNKHPDMANKGGVAKLLVYHCGIGKADKEKALAFFRAQPGLQVIDLTYAQRWEELNKPAPTPKKPKKEGLPAFSCIRSDMGSIRLSGLLRDGAKCVTQPEFVALVSLGRGEPSDYISHWTTYTTQILVDMFGDRGAIVNHRGKYEAALKNGAKPFQSFVEEFLAHEILTNKLIQKHLAWLSKRVIWEVGGEQDRKRDLLAMAYKDTILQKQFGIPKPLPQREEQILQLWERAVKSRLNMSETLNKAYTYIQSIPVSDQAVQMVANLNSSPLTSVVDLYMLKHTMEHAKTGTAAIKQLNTIMQFLFNP